MEYSAVKLQMWRQNENCDLREGPGLGRREVADDWKCGIGGVDPKDPVSSTAGTKVGRKTYQGG